MAVVTTRSSSELAIDPGLLYVAPIGTTEPTASTDLAAASLPSAWREVGYTEDGSVFKYDVKSEKIEVAEELDPIQSVITGRSHEHRHTSSSLIEKCRLSVALRILGDASLLVGYTHEHIDHFPDAKSNVGENKIVYGLAHGGVGKKLRVTEFVGCAGAVERRAVGADAARRERPTLPHVPVNRVVLRERYGAVAEPDAAATGSPPCLRAKLAIAPVLGDEVAAIGVGFTHPTVAARIEHAGKHQVGV